MGFFHKDVSNFIANTTTQGPLFDLPNPAQGAAVQAARAALGGNPGPGRDPGLAGDQQSGGRAV